MASSAPAVAGQQSSTESRISSSSPESERMQQTKAGVYILKELIINKMKNLERKIPFGPDNKYRR